MEACAEAGVTHAHYIVLRLLWDAAPLFKTWLATHFPDWAKRVMQHVCDLHGGKDHDASFGQRMRGVGV